MPEGSSTVSNSNVLSFTSSSGIAHNNVTGNLVIDPTNQIENGFVTINWSGSSMPLISGVSSSLLNIITGSDEIIQQSDYLIGILYSNGKYLISIKSYSVYITPEVVGVLTTTLS